MKGYELEQLDRKRRSDERRTFGSRVKREWGAWQNLGIPRFLSILLIVILAIEGYLLAFTMAGGRFD